MDLPWVTTFVLSQGSHAFKQIFLLTEVNLCYPDFRILFKQHYIRDLENLGKHKFQAYFNLSMAQDWSQPRL